MKSFVSTALAFVIALVAVLAPPYALADRTADSAPTPSDADIAALRKAFQELKPQHGRIVLKGLANLNLPDGLSFLDSKDAATVLVRLWGNPPSSAEGVLGMIIQSPRSVVASGAWAVVITYTGDGHVDDADAQKIDYEKLLGQMKDAVAANNRERKTHGYATVSLIGFAEPPHYDPATHKLYWAKELAFSSGREHTLNYCVRILGRQGVLELNTVAPIDSLPTVRDNSQKILAAVDFNPGNRYADFDRKTDKLATYGIAALVAGGIAGKMGLFKVLIAAVIAGKKLVIVALAGLAAGIKKLFGRSKASEEKTPTLPRQDGSGEG